jgi:hypothetical protein
MKLYHFLVLSLCALSSCIEEQNVFELKRHHLDFVDPSKNGILEIGFNHEGFKGVKIFRKLNLSIKFTISEEDDCVYYIYRPSGYYDKNKTRIPYNSNKTKSEVLREADKLIKEGCFQIELFDKEENTIFSFSNNDDQRNLLQSFNYEMTVKGKLKTPVPTFRSKMKRMSTFKIGIGVGFTSSDMQYF